jgi:glycosyltransferase involved in cell wall biosynthesis
LRIALYHNLTSGGSKREAYEFARQFSLAGHTVHLFHPSTADEDFLPLKQFSQTQTAFDLNLFSDLPIRLPGFRRYVDLMLLCRNLGRLKQLARRAAAQIDAGGYDFVLVHHDRIVQSPYLLRYLKTQSVYYCAEPMREFYEPPIVRPYHLPSTALDRAQRAWYRPALRIRQAIVQAEDCRNVHHARVLLTNSFFTAESIYRAYGLRANVSYLGVDTEKFQPLQLEKQNIVLSVGAVSPLKGYDFIIQALGLIQPLERPKLVIVGNTASAAETQFLQSLASRYAVSLDFCVNLADRDLVALYNRARALVYAPVLEPFGFAPLEAMACATPVVAVKEGGVRESVVDGVTGFLVPRDAAAFAQALSNVLSDSIQARMMGANGREAMLRSWTWLQAYERLIGNLQIEPYEATPYLLR